jgi:hypothetical protein
MYRSLTTADDEEHGSWPQRYFSLLSVQISRSLNNAVTCHCQIITRSMYGTEMDACFIAPFSPCQARGHRAHGSNGAACTILAERLVHFSGILLGCHESVKCPDRLKFWMVPGCRGQGLFVSQAAQKLLNSLLTLWAVQLSSYKDTLLTFFECLLLTYIFASSASYMTKTRASNALYLGVGSVEFGISCRPDLFVYSITLVFFSKRATGAVNCALSYAGGQTGQFPADQGLHTR